MWLFTKYGFFGVVCARQGNGEPHQPVDPNRMAVRARVKEHLDNLVERFPELKGYPVHDSLDADYRYRIFVEKAVWTRISSELANEIDYDRFKPAVVDFPGKEEYKHKLLEVWHVMYEMQLAKRNPSDVEQALAECAKWRLTDKELNELMQ